MNALLGFVLNTLILFSFLLSICVFRSIVLFSRPEDAELCSNAEGHKAIARSDALIQRFSRAIRFKTITKAQRDYDREELLLFHAFIERNFPLIHNSPIVKKEVISNYSLLYSIQGSDASLKPYMLCAHLDVVPVVRDQWKLDPFAGQIQDQFVNGRGSIDVKEMVIASLEALEFLLENSFKPKRSFYLAFGHDEEGMGLEGASEISNVMQKRKVDFEYLLDEGPVIVDGGFKGVPNLVAMVGVAEKGFVTFKLEVNGTTGHSSLPPAETAIVKLAKAVSKFHANTFPSRLGYGPEKDIFEFLAPYASFPYKLFYSNIWLFSPLLSYLLSLQPYTNSLIRTTTAVTVINGGLKENVLPSYSYALINHRIHPSQSVKEALEYDKKLINDAKVSVTINEGASFDPHPLSPYHSASFGFQAIKQSIREVFPQTIVVPGIMFASTDTKWYLKLTKNIYRFRPVVLKTNEFAMIHGHNEKISIDNYVKIVNFYHHLMLISNDKLLEAKNLKDEL